MPTHAKARPDISNYDLARKLADDIVGKPLTDPETIALANVYATLALNDTITALAATDALSSYQNAETWDADILENGETP